MCECTNVYKSTFFKLFFIVSHTVLYFCSFSFFHIFKFKIFLNLFTLKYLNRLSSFIKCFLAQILHHFLIQVILLQTFLLIKRDFELYLSCYHLPIHHLFNVLFDCFLPIFQIFFCLKIFF
jgi:hypothetical protein